MTASLDGFSLNSTRAESTITWQTWVPFPLAGDTVTHGSLVLAIHEPGEDTFMLTVPPSAPISILSPSSTNSTSSFGVQENAMHAEIAANAILKIFPYIFINQIILIFHGITTFDILALVIEKVVGSCLPVCTDVRSIERDVRVVADVEVEYHLGNSVRYHPQVI